MIVYDYSDDDYYYEEYYRGIALQELFIVLKNNFLNLKELSVLEVASGNGWLTRSLVAAFKNVTAIDPELSIEEDYANLTKEKSYFDSSRNYSNYHLFVSCCPCGIEKDIIHASNRYNIPFFIILCNCLHEFKTKEERYLYLKEQVKQSAILYKENSVWYLTNLKVKSRT